MTNPSEQASVGEKRRDPIPYQRRSPRHRPKQERSQGRVTYLDAVKGLAIILVVMGHILHADGDIISPDIDADIGNVIYAFHMPLFFFVSGYIRALSEEKGLMDAKALGRRCVSLTTRLLPAYLLWTLIYFLARLITEPPDPATWLTITLTFRGVAPLWFLGDLLLSELIFLVLEWAFGGRWPLHAGAALVFGAVSVPVCRFMWDVNEAAKLEAASLPPSAVPVYDVPSHIAAYLQITGTRMLPTLFFLFCGYLAARGLARRELPAPVHLLAGAVLLLLAAQAQLQVGNVINLHLCVIKNPLLFFFTGLAGSLGSVELCRGLGSLLPLWILRALGRNSLGIMAVHYPPLPTMALSASWCLLLNPGLALTPVAFLLAQTAMTVAVSALVTFLIQKKLFL